ncbi:MAG: pre-peptidase C-terminal domain-containing protein, partial [Planctomycetales bacterium]|nr:pre-peptidase C-terminal domain-containing protein [Planctomycetales bacterium]
MGVRSLRYETLEDRRLLALTQPVAPAGSMVYAHDLTDAISVAGEVDVLTIDLDAGQTLSLAVDPDAALTADVQIVDTSATLLASGLSSAPGEGVLLQTVPVAAAGTYTISVRGATSSTGSYDLNLVLNAAVEMESVDGLANNDDVAAAQDIDGSFLAIGSGVTERGAVTGTGEGGPDYDVSLTKDNVVFSPNVLTFDFTGAPVPRGAATLVITTTADLDAANEYLTFDAEGLLSQDIFVLDGAQQTEVTTQLTIPLATLTQLAADGTISFTIDPSLAVGSLGANSLSLHLTYAGVGTSDWFSFTLQDGQSTTLALAGPQATAATLELYEGDSGSLLTTGVATANQQVIAKFADISSDGLPNRYYARVAGVAGAYNLVAMRDGDFDAEYNGSLAAAQQITRSGAVLGNVFASDFDYFRVSVNAGDTLRINTSTPGDQPLEFENLLDVGIVLFDPTGASVPYANGTGNESLSHVAALTGDYTVQVFSENVIVDGTYVLEVDGHSGVDAPLEVLSTSPADGSTISGAAPLSQFVVTFSSSVHPLSVDPGDLLIDGNPAVGATIVAADAVAFDLPVLADGVHTVSLAADALKNLQGTPLAAYSGQFTLDNAGPRVVDSSIQDGDVISLGTPLTYTVRFDKPLSAGGLGAEDVALVGAAAGTVAPINLGYDGGTSTLTVEFPSLAEDSYTLTLKSGDGAIEDVAGNDLDGELLASPIGPNVSGDGASGGDFVISFGVDNPATKAFPVPLAVLRPLGSLVYSGSVEDVIDFAGDADTFVVSLDEGQKVSIVVRGSGGLTPQVALTTPDSTVETASAAGPDGTAVLQSISTTLAGAYAIEVTDAGGASGTYSVEIILNAAVESEANGGPSNDDVASAENLDSSFISLGVGTAERGAVVGSGADGSADFYKFSLAPNQSATLALNLQAADGMSLELRDGAGNLLAIGNGASNVEQIISNFVSPGGGVYYASVFGTDANYNLVVARDLDFEVEPNDEVAPEAQDVTLNGTVLGSAAGGSVAPGTTFGLIQEKVPWGKSANTAIAAELGYAVTLVPSSSLATTDLSAFDVLVLAGDQTSTTYSNVADNLDAIESYVEHGGVWLVNYAASSVSLPYSYDVLPDAAGVSFSTLTIKDITVLDPLSGLITGPGGTITDANLDGGSSSAHGFTTSPLPAGADAILATGDPTQIVAFDYPFATGHVVVHAIPVEYYNGVTTDIGQVFHRNLFSFAASFSQDSGDYYSVEATAGDVLSISASAISAGPGEFVNDVDLAIELYDPTGALTAADASGALTHTANLTGLYSVRVTAENSTRGEYVLNVTGHTGALAPFAVEASDPPDGAHILTAPTTLTIDLSDTVLATSVQASDLTVNGVAAIDARFIDGKTLEFTLPAAVEGENRATIAGGAITDIQGQPLEPFEVAYNLDFTPPRVISSSLLEGASHPSSTLVYTAQFDDPLEASALEASDMLLSGVSSGSYTADSFSYDAATSTLTAQYSGLVEDQYSLTLISGVGRFADSFGRALDGEADAVTTIPSGDGIAGGDFVVHFTYDETATEAFPVPLSPIDPAGSGAYRGDVGDGIQFAGDQDKFSLTLEKNQTISVFVEGTGGLTPQVTLVMPGLPLSATAVAPGPNEAAVLQAIPTTVTGDYEIRVEGADDTVGSYTITVLVNAVAELEDLDGSDNELRENAQNLDLSFQSRGTLGGSMTTVAGRGDVAAGPTYSDSQTQNGNVYTGNVLTYDFSLAPAPLGDAVLTVTALADLDLASEYLRLEAEGAVLQDLFVSGGSQSTQVTTQVTIPLATLTQLAADGTISFAVTPSSNVNNLGSNFLTLSLEYAIGAPTGGDWYQFSLVDGETATLALDSASGAVLQLVDAAGDLVATGVESVNVAQVIANFADQTSDGLPETYFVHVTSVTGPYGLVVARNSDFDAEPNEDFANAQDIGGTLGVSGHVIANPSPPTPQATAAVRVVAEEVPLPETNVPPIQTVYFDPTWEAGKSYSEDDLPVLVGAGQPSAIIASAASTQALVGPISILQTFAGPGYSNGVPPDPTLAAGPQQVVAIVNTSIAIYDNSTGTQLFSQSLNGNSGFFGSTGATTTIFDPWVLYDTDSDRFFAIGIDQPSSSTSYLYLAVSTDSTPTSGGDWHKYRVPFTHTPSGGLGSGVHFADYPKLGVSDDAVWVSGNYFPITSGSGVYAGITAFEKGALANGSAVNVLYQEFFEGFSVMPMTQYDSGNTQYFAESSTGSGSSIRIHAVSDVLTTPTRTTASVAVPSFQAPNNIPQLGAGVAVDSIDARVMTGVWRDGSMWFAHAITDPAVDTEAVVRWYEVATNNFPSGSTPTLRQSGNVDPGPGLHTWIPAISADARGNMAVGFSIGGPNTYLGAGFTGRLANDALGTTVLPVTQYVAGLGTYQITDGSGRNRWGDYSGLAVDPENDGVFWVFNEYPTALNTWATQIASFQLEQPVDDDWYQFGVRAGDILRIQTSTPGGGSGEPLNLLDPSIELYDPNGNLIPHANAAGNELLFHAAQQSGQYRVRVFSETTDGEYFLQVEGATGGSLPPFVVDADPDIGSKLNAFPSTYALSLSEAALPSSLQASDLLVGGLPAVSLTVIDSKTLEFTIDPAVNIGSGVYQVELAADAIQDLQGSGNLIFTTSFEVDATPPVIVDTFWNGSPLKISRLYDEGPLTFQAVFSEDLFLAGSARRGLFTPGPDDVFVTEVQSGIAVYPLTVDYDPAADLLTAEFGPLAEGDYTLTILSGSGAVEDLVGNDLDGEPLGPDFDGTTTGDGTAGGDYSVDFFVDRTTPAALQPFANIGPLGGLIASSSNNTGFINSAGDQEVFEFVFEAGQTLAAIVHPADPLATLTAQIVGVTPIYAAVAPGQPVVLPVTVLAATGLYELRVSGDAKSHFSMDVIVNAAIEPGDDTADGRELAIDNSLLDLGSSRYAVIGNSSASVSASDLIANGSFETGDLSDWTAATTPGSNPLQPWTISQAGAGFPQYSLAATAPQDGDFVAWNGFDGSGPMEYTMYQDVALPADPGPLLLSWQDRVQWNYTLGGTALMPRLYDVQVRDPATDAVLTTLRSFSTDVQAVNPTGDTGWQLHAADLRSFAGQTVRLYFVEQIPENSTGPAQLEIDAVSLPNPGGGGPDADEFTLDLSGKAGRRLDVVLAGLDGIDFSGQLLELLDDAGNVLATASADPLGAGA